MGKKIAWLSDFDLRGSGYLNISIPLCTRLIQLGHQVKAIGLGYQGQEHDHPFSIIPCQTLPEVKALLSNLINLWGIDVLIVAMDIPVQEQIMLMIPPDKPFKYYGIMPIEADPLCMSWAMVLMQMDKQYIISEFGKQEAIKMGISAEHIPVGLDSSWRVPTKDEREKLRDSFGIAQDERIILTVADNQERKNLARAMEMFADFSLTYPKSRYIMVTREHNYVGWKLRDYAQELGINNQLMIFERGLSFKELWSLYALSDVFLLPSKAEGFGVPLLEAMACGITPVSTNCTAVAELLADNRGYLIEPDYIYRDPFGNGKRYLASRKDGAEKLVKAIEHPLVSSEYALTRTWDAAVEMLNKDLESL